MDIGLILFKGQTLLNAVLSENNRDSVGKLHDEERAAAWRFSSKIYLAPFRT